MTATYTCPRCSSVSHHPEDVRHQYCGRCHDYTGPAGAPAGLRVTPYGPGTPDPLALLASRCWSVGTLVAHTYPIGADLGDTCHCGEATLSDEEPE